MFFSEDLAQVRQNYKYGFIDKKGRVVIPFQFDATGSFSEGLVQVWQDGKCGFIDKKGKVVVPFRFDTADSFRKVWRKFGKMVNVALLIKRAK